MKNDERRARATLTVDVLTTAEVAGQRQSWRSDSDGRLRTGRRRGRDEQGEAARGGWASGEREGTVGATVVRARLTVRTSGALSRHRL
jgi:hypothetical protein